MKPEGGGQPTAKNKFAEVAVEGEDDPIFAPRKFHHIDVGGTWQ